MLLISLYVILFSQSKNNSSHFCNWYMIRSYLRPYNSNTQRALQFAISALHRSIWIWLHLHIGRSRHNRKCIFHIPFCSSKRLPYLSASSTTFLHIMHILTHLFYNWIFIYRNNLLGAFCLKNYTSAQTMQLGEMDKTVVAARLLHIW